MSGASNHDVMSILNQLQNLIAYQQQQQQQQQSASVAPYASSGPNNNLTNNNINNINPTPEEILIRALAAALTRNHGSDAAPQPETIQSSAAASAAPRMVPDSSHLGQPQTTATRTTTTTTTTLPADLLQRTLLQHPQHGSQEHSISDAPVNETPTFILFDPSALARTLQLQVPPPSAPDSSVLFARTLQSQMPPSSAAVGGNQTELQSLLSLIMGSGGNESSSQLSHIPNLNPRSHTWLAAVLGNLSLPVAEQIDAGAASFIRLPSASIAGNAQPPGMISGISPSFPVEARIQQSSQAVFSVGPTIADVAAASHSVPANNGWFPNTNQLQAAEASMPTLASELRNYDDDNNNNNHSGPAESEAADSANPSSMMSRNKRKYTHENFVHKLHRIVTQLEQEGNENVATFMTDGGIWVRDKDTFVNNIMPMNFRGQGWSSFRRQLFSYRFSALPPSSGKIGAYTNEYFKRGQPELCEQILRDDRHDKINRRIRAGHQRGT
ncbi:hypothetical protein ACA910_006516 [Epithemia clementina (nom. ined.)]